MTYITLISLQPCGTYWNKMCGIVVCMSMRKKERCFCDGAGDVKDVDRDVRTIASCRGREGACGGGLVNLTFKGMHTSWLSRAPRNHTNVDVLPVGMPHNVFSGTRAAINIHVMADANQWRGTKASKA